MENKLWEKFYECDCHGEGIMISYEGEEKDGLPLIDLAFFGLGFEGKTLSFREKLKWCWHVIKNGKPYLDCVILNKDTAKELGKDLINFSEKKYKL